MDKPKQRLYFSGGELCRNCGKHKSICVCPRSSLHSIEKVLTPKQEKFLRNYIQSTGAMCGNGTLSYANAYGYDLENADTTRQLDENGKQIQGTSQRDKMAKLCEMSASRMLSNVIIEPHITALYMELMEDHARVDRELMKLVLKGDISAIREYNALKQRITKKIDLTTKGASIVLTDEQRAKLDALFEEKV